MKGAAQDPSPLREKTAGLFATLFGIGRLPWAPGTLGSLAALPPAWFLLEHFGALGLVSASLFALAGGVWSAQILIERTARRDPQEVVIDELLGQWVTILLIGLFLPFHYSLGNYVMAFAAFRIFDIWKPAPIPRLEEELDDGLGVMFDDLVAAIYAAAAVLILKSLL